MSELEEIIAAVEAAEADDEAYQDQQIRNLGRAILALNAGLISALARLNRHLQEAGEP